MGWTKNRWVRLFFALWVLWAAVDASLLLLNWAFPGHLGAHGLYRQSGPQRFLSTYLTGLSPRDHPNVTRLTAVLRIGPAIVASLYVAWRLVFGSHHEPISN